MTEKEVTRLIAQTLFPWNEEISAKFASMDSMRQAEQVYKALVDAGAIKHSP